MSTSRPFSYISSQSAYYTGLPPTGTHRVGNILIGLPLNGFDAAGLEGWNGSDEELGYIIPIPVPSDIQPTNVEYRTYLDVGHKGANITEWGSPPIQATQADGFRESILGFHPINEGDKVMFSVQVELTGAHPYPTDHFIGIGKQTMNYEGPGGWPGNDNLSIGYCNNGNIYANGGTVVGTGATWTDGDIIDIVINTQTSGMSTRVNGGDWDNDPSHDPANSPNMMGAEIFQGPFYPVLSPEEGGSMTIKNSSTYSVPAGYKFLGDITASVGFVRSSALTDQSFIDLVNSNFNQSFTALELAKLYLDNNNYWSSYGISFTINSSDFTSGNGYGGSSNALGTNGIDGFENTAPENDLAFGYYAEGLNPTAINNISAAVTAAGLNPTNSTGYIWNVTWGAGSSIASGLVKFGFYNSGQFWIEAIDPTDSAWSTPGYQNGTSLVGQFKFPATFTPYISLIEKGGWC